MKKTFFFVLMLFTIQSAFAQENILVEYFRYNQDSAKYELEETILREYEEGIEPEFDYSTFALHPLSAPLEIRAFFSGVEVSSTFNTSEYLFDNCNRVITKNYTGKDYDKTYDFFYFSDSVIRRISNNQKFTFIDEKVVLEQGLFPYDSIIFNLEKDKYTFKTASIINDFYDEKCEFIKHYKKIDTEVLLNYDLAKWKLIYDYKECDSIRENMIFGHEYNTENSDSAIIILFKAENSFVDSTLRIFTNLDKRNYNKEIIKNFYTSDSIMQIYTQFLDDDLIHVDSNFSVSDFEITSHCESNICYEYDEKKNITKIFIEVSPPVISVGRYYFENYSLGFEIDTVTGLEIITDSMVMHRNYIITSSEKSLQNKNQSEINIFPNPSTGIINIQLENTVPFNVEVVDIQGRSIRKEEGLGSLQISNLDKGSYIIKLITSQGVSTQRIEVFE